MEKNSEDAINEEKKGVSIRSILRIITFGIQWKKKHANEGANKENLNRTGSKLSYSKSQNFNNDLQFSRRVSLDSK